MPAVVGNLPHRGFDGVQHDVDADLLVSLGGVANLFNRLAATDQSHAAAGENAFFHRCASGVQGIFHAGFLLLHFGFRAGADGNNRHAAGQLGQAFLEFFAIVIAFGIFDLIANLLKCEF